MVLLFVRIIFLIAAVNIANLSLCVASSPPSRGKTLRVICSPKHACPLEKPICCGESEGYTTPFCQQSDAFCCDRLDGKENGGCILGTTCCLGERNGTRVRSCCPPSMTCTRDGRCASDRCQLIPNATQCNLISSCHWCCNGQCMNINDYDHACTVPAEACRHRCSERRSCGSCTSDPSCQWCCSTATCTHRTDDITRCGNHSLLTGDKGKSPNCSVCEKGGRGIYHEFVDGDRPPPVSSEISDFNLYLTAMIAVLLIMFFAVRLYHRVKKALVSRSQGGGTERSAPQEMTSVFEYVPVPKHRFFDLTDTIPTEIKEIPPPSGMEAECVICLAAVSQVMFHPCGHVSCCCQCSYQWEDTHVASQKALHESRVSRGPAGRLRCPLCRVDVEIMLRVR